MRHWPELWKYRIFEVPILLQQCLALQLHDYNLETPTWPPFSTSKICRKDRSSPARIAPTAKMTSRYSFRTLYHRSLSPKTTFVTTSSIMTGMNMLDEFWNRRQRSLEGSQIVSRWWCYTECEYTCDCLRGWSGWSRTLASCRVPRALTSNLAEYKQHKCRLSETLPCYGEDGESLRRYFLVPPISPWTPILTWTKSLDF